MKSLQHHSLRHPPPLRRRHSIDIPPSSLSSSAFLKSATATAGSLTTHASFSLSPASSSSSNTLPSTSSGTVSLDVLARHLSAGNFREADEETRRLLIVLAGEAAVKRGYVFFSEVKFIPEEELRAIDELWRRHSKGRFGYSVQKRIWEKVNGDFTRFFLKVGWMKKLNTEVEQYNYRSFPEEFMWEGSDDTPEGHLPLTNALRGTQLLANILSHPAFHNAEQEKDAGEANGEEDRNGVLNRLDLKKDSSRPSITKRVFKPDYSF